MSRCESRTGGIKSQDRISNRTNCYQGLADISIIDSNSVALGDGYLVCRLRCFGEQFHHGAPLIPRISNLHWIKCSQKQASPSPRCTARIETIWYGVVRLIAQTYDLMMEDKKI